MLSKEDKERNKHMKKLNSSKIEYLNPIKIPDIIKKIKQHKNPLIILRYICYFIPILVSMYFYTILYPIYKTELMQLLLASIGLISPLMALVIAIRPFEEKIKYYNKMIEITTEFHIIYILFEGDTLVNFNRIGNKISEIEPLFWKVLNFRPRIVNSKDIESGYIDNFRFRHDITFIGGLWKLTLINTEDTQDIVLHHIKSRKSYHYSRPTENEEVRDAFLQHFVNNVGMYVGEKLYKKSHISFLKYMNHFIVENKHLITDYQKITNP